MMKPGARHDMGQIAGQIARRKHPRRLGVAVGVDLRHRGLDAFYDLGVTLRIMHEIGGRARWRSGGPSRARSLRRACTPSGSAPPRGTP